MNAINYALKEIRWEIPEEILILATTIDIPDESKYTTSVDDKIVARIIRSKVLMDANLVGGIELVISLDGIPIQLDNYYNGVFRVPMERTNGRLIINALGVGSISMTGNSGNLGGIPQLPSAGGGIGGSCCNPAPTYMSNQANRIYNSYKGTLSDLNPNTTIIAPNTILVQGMRFFSGNMLGARVTVENDDNLNNLSPRSYTQFGVLCVLAAKAFVHRQLGIALDRGYLSGGQELSRITSIVDDYSSAYEDYRTYLREVWQGVAFLNDPQKKNRLISSMLNTNF